MFNTEAFPFKVMGLVDHFSVRSALSSHSHVVPTVGDRVAGDASRNPVSIHVVPDVPFVAPGYAALRAPGDANRMHEPVNIELHRLRIRSVGHVEIGVIGELVQTWHLGAIQIVSI